VKNISIVIVFFNYFSIHSQEKVLKFFQKAVQILRFI